MVRPPFRDRGRALLAGCACAALLGAPAAARAQAAPPPPIKVGPLTIGGLVQADHRATFDQASEDGSDGFLLRRARLSLSGDLAPTISFTFQGEFTGSPIARDLYVTFTGIRGAAIRAGQFIAPYSLERLTSTTRLELIDRTVAGDTLTPSRDVGVMVFNPRPFWGWLSYQAAIVNGAGQNTRDDNDAKDLVGRVAAAMPRVPGLTVGLSGNAGRQPAGDRRRGGIDVVYDRPRYRLTAERLTQSLDGPAARDVTAVVLVGVWKQPAATITDYFAGYELAARFLDVDDEAAALTTRELQFGGNYYVTPQVRVMSNLIVPIGDEPRQTRTRWWSRLQVLF